MKLCFACVRSAGVNRAVLFLRASFFSFLLLLLLLPLLLFLHRILLILQVAEEVAIPKFLRILSFSSCSRSLLEEDTVFREGCGCATLYYSQQRF